MSASYIAKQIIKGGLPYAVVVPPSNWSKLKEEVDALLIEMGHGDLIQGYEEETPDDEVVEDEPITIPEIEEEV